MNRYKIKAVVFETRGSEWETRFSDKAENIQTILYLGITAIKIKRQGVWQRVNKLLVNRGETERYV